VTPLEGLGDNMAFQSITIPFGNVGLNFQENQLLLSPGDLVQGNNITQYGGLTAKMRGIRRFNTTSVGDVNVYAYVFKTAATQKICGYTDGGKILDVAATGASVELKTGLDTNKYPVFAEGYGSSSIRKLFIFNNANTPQTWDGVDTVTADISNPNTDWAANKPAGAVMYANRLWAWGNANYLHTMYASSATDHENFTPGGGAVLMTVYAGEGEKIIGCIAALGKLFIFKRPFGIYMIDASDPTSTNWTVKRVTYDYGIAGPYACATDGVNVIFLGYDGLPYAVVPDDSTLTGVDIKPLGHAIIGSYVQDDINYNQIHSSIVYAFKENNEIWICYPNTANVYCTKVLILDTNNEKKPKFLTRSRDNILSCMTWLDTTNSIRRPLIGSNTGLVRALNHPTLYSTDGDVGYTSTIETQPIWVSQQGSQKVNLKELELFVDSVNGCTLTVEVIKDGSATLIQTLTFEFAAGSDKTRMKKRIYGTCRKVALRITHSEGNKDFGLSMAKIYCSPGSGE
jgi:hypothetical protein